jgi:type VI protein secretion system component VasK
MSRRAAWTLIALCAWSLWVWLTFTWIIGHQDHPMGFKVVHGLIAVGSIAFGLAAGWIGYRGLRPAHPAPSEEEIGDREVMESR